MQKYWIILPCLGVAFCPAKLLAMMMDGASGYNSMMNSVPNVPSLFQGMFEWNQPQYPQSPQNQFPPYPVPQQQSPQYPSSQPPSYPYPQSPSHSPQGLPFPQSGSQASSPWGVFNNVVHGTQQEQQSSREQFYRNQQTQWQLVCEPICKRVPPNDVIKALEGVETWAKKEGVFAPINLLAFVCSPLPPAQTSNLVPHLSEKISLLEVCVFTKNAPAFEVLTKKFVGKDATLTKAFLQAWETPIHYEGVRQLNNVQPLTKSYANLLHYVLETQRVDEFGVLLKALEVSDQKQEFLQKTVVPLLYQTLIFFDQNQIVITDKFWKVLSDELLKSLVEYEKGHKGMRETAYSLPVLFIAAKAGRLDVLKRLIQSGADIQVQVDQKSFALYLPNPTPLTNSTQPSATTAGRRPVISSGKKNNQKIWSCSILLNGF